MLKEDSVKVEYLLLYLERMELGTPYLQIVNRVKTIILDQDIRGNVTTIADATGVGLPVVQMMRTAMIAPLVPITIHGGTNINEKDNGYSVPKRDLVTALVSVVQSRRLRVAHDIDHRQQLVHEMQSFTADTKKGGADTYEALMEKDHDDLVLALSYAIWYPERTLGSVHYNTKPSYTGDRDLLS
jgi:hypothetical protein